MFYPYPSFKLRGEGGGFRWKTGHQVDTLSKVTTKDVGDIEHRSLEAPIWTSERCGSSIDTKPGLVNDPRDTEGDCWSVNRMSRVKSTVRQTLLKELGEKSKEITGDTVR